MIPFLPLPKIFSPHSFSFPFFLTLAHCFFYENFTYPASLFNLPNGRSVTNHCYRIHALRMEL